MSLRCGARSSSRAARVAACSRGPPLRNGVRQVYGGRHVARPTDWWSIRWALPPARRGHRPQAPARPCAPPARADRCWQWARSAAELARAPCPYSLPCIWRGYSSRSWYATWAVPSRGCRHTRACERSGPCLSSRTTSPLEHGLAQGWWRGRLVVYGCWQAPRAERSPHVSGRFGEFSAMRVEPTS